MSLSELDKTKSKLKMMEISFEQINNSRNDLIKQLSDTELLYEKLLSKLREINFGHACYTLSLHSDQKESNTTKWKIQELMRYIEK